MFWIFCSIIEANLQLLDTVNVTDAQLKAIESQVNEKIREAVSVEVKVYEGDAIPDQVRIYLQLTDNFV